MKLTDRPSHHRFYRLSRSGAFTALTIASLLAHVLVLGLPWPTTEEVAEPPELPSEPQGESVIDVAILPAEQPTAPADAEAVTPAEAATEPPQVASESPSDPTALVEPPPVAESPPPESPRPDAETAPSTEPPIDEGTGDLTTPESQSPPTLEERLQDVTAYQYDGRKTLKESDAYLESSKWVVNGQVLPENVDPLVLPYALDNHCLDRSPEVGLLAVVLDASGNFMRGPEIVDSTGYEVLDELAKAMIV
ncbi:MAG: hypothetical protein AAF722_11405, partial [Cyanobacteria bacterium P01_C01_bin.70]